MNPTFTQLNQGWNAEPNAPNPQATWQGDTLILRFRTNSFQFPEYDEDDIGELNFEDYTRYRSGTVNDEGWYRDQGRFGRNGHRWGQFYEVARGLSPEITPDDWDVRCQDDGACRHYLFYFRDEDFECVARCWSLRITKAQQGAPSNR